MSWLFIWKVVVAGAALVMIVNAVTIAVGATRDAVQVWTTPRVGQGK